MGAKHFTHTHRVTYHECTVGNHVYYARYLDILEEARGEFFRALEMPCRQLQEEGILFPAVECQLKYKAAARYDDVLAVEVWVAELRSVRVTFGYRILNPAEKVILEGTTMHACTDGEDKPKRIPAKLEENLRVYLAAKV